jgi:hypothetical protein
MSGANAKLFVVGLVALAVGLAPVIPKSSQDVVSGWFILYTFPLVLGGAGLMALACLRSVVVFFGIERHRATLLVGGVMVLQYFIVSAVQPGFVVYALSFGVAFTGFMACLTVVVPVLRDLRAGPRSDRRT